MINLVSAKADAGMYGTESQGARVQCTYQVWLSPGVEFVFHTRQYVGAFSAKIHERKIVFSEESWKNNF